MEFAKMELFKSDLSSKIETVKNELITKKGEDAALSRIVGLLVGGAKKCVADANKSTSVDDRLQILVGGLQEIVGYVENESEKIKKEVLLLENKGAILEEVLQLANKSVTEEKKMADSEKPKET